MIGIVLVTHGNLAREFIAALEHVVGPQQGISAVCIGADDDMERRRVEILESVKSSNTGDGVIVLTDMFGGTPSKLAISVMGLAGAEVLAGVNLPMLVKLASLRSQPITEAVGNAQQAGRKIHHRRITLPHQERPVDLRYIQPVLGAPARLVLA
jgi:PTS system mannose-specific IIA component